MQNNIRYKLPPDEQKVFKKLCTDMGIYMADALTGLIRDFINSKRREPIYDDRGDILGFTKSKRTHKRP